jgi:hypothetical protein
VPSAPGGVDIICIAYFSKITVILDALAGCFVIFLTWVLAFVFGLV